MMTRTSGFARPLLRPLLVLSVLAVTSAAVEAQPDDHSQHGVGMDVACAACPPPRESSGTSWQPDDTGMNHSYRRLGAWLVGTHLEVTAVGINESGPRGDTALVAPSHGMLNLRRTTGKGIVGIKTMWSLDPLMGARGYPLLVQSGESADGVSALVDRQHPHDFVMELAATYRRAVQDVSPARCAGKANTQQGRAAALRARSCLRRALDTRDPADLKVRLYDRMGSSAEHAGPSEAGPR
jgi:hypothetical protein